MKKVVEKYYKSKKLVLKLLS